ncbi:MAG TPA: PepSY-associated TM helix domain-containing protein [Armatimonadota bacterium]|nr:PepSY-associated TM helix domain-containing protein [Armatimonadota bacterium]
MAEERRRFHWRPLVRSWHRDMGYLAVGLTLVYAVSGLAVNHIADWDPNFKSYERAYQLPRGGAGVTAAPDDRAAAASVLAELGIREPVRQVFRAPDRLDIRLDRRTLHVDPSTGRVVEEGQKPRFFLRAANWLHLNRGKKAWTVVADAYAAGLLFLAISGLFMLPGKNGLRGRGGILVAVGAAVPILYVLFSGPR